METALLRVTNDILMTLVISLFSFFWTSIQLIVKLGWTDTGTGLTEVKLLFTGSHLTYQTGSFLTRSSTALMSIGVPQGSVLGPVLFGLFYSQFHLCPTIVRPMTPHCMSRLSLKIVTIWILCTAASLALRTGWFPTSCSWTQIRL